MAGTVVTDLAFFQGATTGNSSCDTSTDWTGTGLAVDTVQFIQGTGSLWSYSAATTTIRYWTFSCQATNVSGKAIYLWFALGKVAWLNTKANGGVSIRLSDGTNWAEWYFAGSDTLPHNGFICHVVHVDTPPNASSGTLNKNAVTQITIIARGSFPGKAYLWLDAVRFGSYIRVYGGTSSDPATFNDIVSADNANAYGVFRYSEGAIYAQIPIEIGDPVGTNSTYFKDTDVTIFFRDVLVTSTYYYIKGRGNSTGTTEIYFGNKVGSAGVSGIYVRSVGAVKYALDFSDQYITKFGLYGCTFSRARTVVFPSYDPNKEVLSCTFSECGEVLASTCLITYCKFIASPSTEAGAVKIDSTSHHISYCDFINCYRAIHFTISGTLNYFDHLNFFSNTYDGYATAGTLTVNFTNCSPAPSTYDPSGYTITWQTSITLTIRHVKSGNEPNEYVQCAIFRKSDMYPLMNQEATTPDDQNPGYYKATTSYQGATGFVVVVRARKKGWIPFEAEVYLSGDLDISAVWLRDPNFNPY